MIFCKSYLRITAAEILSFNIINTENQHRFALCLSIKVAFSVQRDILLKYCIPEDIYMRSNLHFANEKLRAFVTELINGTPPGTRLPGIRTMMNDANCGRIKLEHLLEEFARDGIIEIRPRSGIYRCAVEHKLILFIHYSQLPVVEVSDNFIGGTLKALRSYIEKNGWVLNVVNASDLSAEKLTALLKSLRCRCAFIWGARNSFETSLINSVIPCCVDILPRHTAELIAEVRDSEDMTSIQMEYLLQRNYRRIAFIHNAEKDWSRTPVQLHRLLEYYRIMAENALKVEPEWVFYCGYNWDHFQNCMRKMMQAERLPEAVVVPGGSTLRSLYRFCRIHNISIGRELAVISCDDDAGDLTPAPTRLTNTPSEIARQAWQIMQQQLAGKTVREYTRLRIITGETVPHKQ